MKRTRYRYVDFAATSQPGFRNHIVTVDEVPALVVQAGTAECYASIFHFSDDVLLYLADHRVNGRPTIAGYDGRIWAPFLPLDIDGDATPGGQALALDVARLTYLLLVEHWHVPDAAIYTYFSGAKGFHLQVDTRAFGGVRPARDLHRVFSRIRLGILRALPDAARPAFDLAIGDKVRLLRLPNTRHHASGLYKVALSPAELLTCSWEDIRRLARTPRPLRGVVAAGLLPAEPIGTVTRLEQLLGEARRAVRRERGPHPYRFGPVPARPEDGLCAARLEMWRSHIPRGNRNNVAIRLASAFRLAGHDRRHTLDLLLTWNERQRIGLPTGEIQGVVHSAYARPHPYAYGCHDEVIRSFCPYANRLNECADYRAHHPRSGRSV